jgi:hypothetical protein
MGAWTGLIWLRIGTDFGLCLMWLWTFESQQIRRISWLAENLLASQEGLCSMMLAVYDFYSKTIKWHDPHLVHFTLRRGKIITPQFQKLYLIFHLELFTKLLWVLNKLDATSVHFIIYLILKVTECNKLRYWFIALLIFPVVVLWDIMRPTWSVDVSIAE